MAGGLRTPDSAVEDPVDEEYIAQHSKHIAATLSSRLAPCIRDISVDQNPVRSRR